MIEVALLLHSGNGVNPVRVRMATLPRNGEYVSFDGHRYVVTQITHLVGSIPVLASSPEVAEKLYHSTPVQVEVSAWMR
jgi:hypothetical protein